MSISVFLSDDKPIILESLEKTIQWSRLGYQVVGTARNGDDALADIRRLRPQVLITDIRMPGIDGLSLASEVKEILPDTRILVITGYDKFEYAQRSLRIGVEDIILKPIKNIDLEALLCRISDSMKAHHMEKQGEDRPGSDASDDAGELPIDEAHMGSLTRAVSQYIEHNLGEDLSLNTMAGMYRVSPSHLSKVFKKETGQTYLRYVTSRRLCLAKVMLGDPANRIAEIAFACGFTSPEHFSKIFREYEHISPSDYKKDKNR